MHPPLLLSTMKGLVVAVSPVKNTPMSVSAIKYNHVSSGIFFKQRRNERVVITGIMGCHQIAALLDCTAQ